MPGVLRGVTSLVMVAGLVVAAGPASGVTRGAATTAAPMAVSQTRGLVVQVTLSKTRVRIGHRLRVDYSWRDGNGDLVDTNRIGTMAIHVLRNVQCTRTSTAAHPIHGSGTWWYRNAVRFADSGYKNGSDLRQRGCLVDQMLTARQPFVLSLFVGLPKTC